MTRCYLWSIMETLSVVLHTYIVKRGEQLNHAATPSVGKQPSPDEQYACRESGPCSCCRQSEASTAGRQAGPRNQKEKAAQGQAGSSGRFAHLWDLRDSHVYHVVVCDGFRIRIQLRGSSRRNVHDALVFYRQPSRFCAWNPGQAIAKRQGDGHRRHHLNGDSRCVDDDHDHFGHCDHVRRESGHDWLKRMSSRVFFRTPSKQRGRLAPSSKRCLLSGKGSADYTETFRAINFVMACWCGTPDELQSNTTSELSCRNQSR